MILKFFHVDGTELGRYANCDESDAMIKKGSVNKTVDSYGVAGCFFIVKFFLRSALTGAICCCGHHR